MKFEKKDISLSHYSFRIGKENKNICSLDTIVDHYKNKIENDPIAYFIGIFDHYSHTQKVNKQGIPENIKDVKNVLFCFGKDIANEDVAMFRPRSIAIVEMEDSFFVGFLEAPNTQATEKMIAWSNFA